MSLTILISILVCFVVYQYIIKNTNLDIKKMKEEEIITKLMHDNNTGFSITELVLKTNLSRSAVRTYLAHLEGANKITVRKIGMAKVYYLNQVIPKAPIKTQSIIENEMNKTITTNNISEY